MRPLPGWAIIEPEEKKMDGLIELPDSAKAAMQRGTIVEVNPKWAKDGTMYELEISAGMNVVFRKYYDNDLEIGGKKYKVVHCENIMTVID